MPESFQRMRMGGYFIDVPVFDAGTRSQLVMPPHPLAAPVTQAEASDRWAAGALRLAMELLRESGAADPGATLRPLLTADAEHWIRTPLKELIARVNVVLAGWVQYFRVGNANRAFSEMRD